MEPQEIAEVGAALGRPILRTRTLAGGFSHETCLLEFTSEATASGAPHDGAPNDGGPDARAVVRMGGADPAIEAAVMAVAARQVPVPAVRVVRPASVEHGTRPYMVLDHVPGTALSEVLLEPVDHRTLGAEVGRVAARIGRIAFDRPGFFVDEALTVRADPPWSRQLAEMAEDCMGRTPTDRLAVETRTAWAELCATHAPSLAEVDDDARLAHADLNPKNILVSSTSDGWRVDAILDWEFSYSGCPYSDVANMARFGADYPDGFLGGFRTGFAANQPPDRRLPDNWLYLGHVFDMFALSDLVTRPLGHPVADRAAAEIRRWIRDGVPGYK